MSWPAFILLQKGQNEQNERKIHASPTKGVQMNYPPLEEVTTPFVKTSQAAHYLQLQRSTLCAYAKSPTPPVEAIRVGNKFFFKTADIKNLLKIKGVAE